VVPTNQSVCSYLGYRFWSVGSEGWCGTWKHDAAVLWYTHLYAPRDCRQQDVQSAVWCLGHGCHCLLLVSSSCIGLY